MTETELKFRIDPGAHARLRSAAALAGVAPVRRRIVSYYFDTPRGDLAKNAIALRLRRVGRRWVQSLKAGGGSQGALHARGEWEFDRPGPAIDLALFADTALARLEGAQTLHLRLRLAFAVCVVRETWHVAPAPGSRLEVALDSGQVEARGRIEPLSEVEIECLEGGAAAAFELAERLLAEVPLIPSAVTKAERGRRLAAGAALQPARARTLALEPAMAPIEAARAIVAAGLAQLQGNEEGLLASAHPEFVHQARIAIRRLRSGLRMFRDAVGSERAERWRAAFDETAKALGTARDWDVFANETLPEVAAAHGDLRLARSLRARATRRRTLERKHAREALRSPGYARIVLDCARWLAEEAAPAEAPPAEDLARFASRLIRKRHKRLAADCERLQALAPAERHRVRIDAKKLRYGVDALGSVFPKKRVRRYADTLAELQDALGRSNDAVNAGRLLAAFEVPSAFAEFARGWFAAVARGDADHLENLAERIRQSRRFWLKKPAA